MVFSRQMLRRLPAAAALVPSPTASSAASGARRISNLAHNVVGADSGATAPPVIIMHGLFGSKQNWNSLSKAFHAKSQPLRQVIAVDARNHGDSPHTETNTYEELADDVREFLQARQIPKAVVIGHSMGGRAMMCMALKYPEMVEKAVIVDISPVKSSPQLEGMLEMFASMMSVTVPSHLSLSDGRKLANELLRDKMHDETRQFVMMNFTKREDGTFGWRTNVETLHRDFVEHIARFPAHLMDKQYGGPTLFVGGMHSDYIAVEHMPAIKKMFPNSELEMLNAGHLVHIDAPQDFLRVTLDFINRK